MQKLSASALAFCLGIGSTVHANPPPAAKTRTVLNAINVSGSTEIDDPNNCLEGTFYTNAYEETSKDASGTKVTTRTVSMFAFIYDSCEEASGYGFVDMPLATALSTQSFTYTFATAAEFYPASGEGDPTYRQVSGTVTITADPTGDVQKSHETTTTLIDGQRTVVRSKGNTRDADAIITKAKIDGSKLKFLPGTGSMGTTKNATIETTRY